jgi:rubrerythrin
MIADRDVTYHVCTVCGYVAEDEAPDKCPVCGVPRARFRRVD